MSLSADAVFFLNSLYEPRCKSNQITDTVCSGGSDEEPPSRGDRKREREDLPASGEPHRGWSPGHEEEKDGGETRSTSSTSSAVTRSNVAGARRYLDNLQAIVKAVASLCARCLDNSWAGILKQHESYD